MNNLIKTSNKFFMINFFVGTLLCVGACGMPYYGPPTISGASKDGVETAKKEYKVEYSNAEELKCEELRETAEKFTEYCKGPFVYGNGTKTEEEARWRKYKYNCLFLYEYYDRCFSD